MDGTSSWPSRPAQDPSRRSVRQRSKDALPLTFVGCLWLAVAFVPPALLLTAGYAFSRWVGSALCDSADTSTCDATEPPVVVSVPGLVVAAIALALLAGLIAVPHQVRLRRVRIGLLVATVVASVVADILILALPVAARPRMGGRD
jgi:hypothetical protein